MIASDHSSHVYIFDDCIQSQSSVNWILVDVRPFFICIFIDGLAISYSSVDRYTIPHRMYIVISVLCTLSYICGLLVDRFPIVHRTERLMIVSDLIFSVYCC